MRTHRALQIAALVLAAACGSGVAEDAGGLLPGQFNQPVGSSALRTDNGMTANGMTANGMTANGMTANGMSANGLYFNGLALNGLTLTGVSKPAFSTWFAGNAPGYSNMVMTYLVRCALGPTESLSYTNSAASYTWQGNLGLAPVWAKGSAIPVVEQQLVSACLGAHANKYGIHIDLSIRGEKSDNTYLTVDSIEDSTYPVDEACFFGNLFDGTGVFASTDRTFSDFTLTSPRACAINPTGNSACLPLVALQEGCAKLCTVSSGVTPSEKGTYRSCTRNKVSYRSLNTHLKPSDVNKCGDGICQFTESCYKASDQTGCKLDCGTCP